MTRTKSAVTQKSVKSADVVSLERKTEPSQDRSRETYGSIVTAAGELLAERGIDAFNINALVQRTGLTPPAIYRYFPNKYAILKELGRQLMEAQDEVVLAAQKRWRGKSFSETALINETFDVLSRLVKITADFPGGAAVLRAMRAVPILREVRLLSSEMVASRRVELLSLAHPHSSPERLRNVAWVIAEIGNSVIELVVENKEESRSSEALLRECAIMLARLQTSLS
jgi:AcrR family transcriptional regulator